MKCNKTDFSDSEANLYGYLAVLGAILFFGSFAVPLKSKRVSDAKVDPVVFQIYYSISIFLSSWVVLIWFHSCINDWGEFFSAVPWGIIAASCFVPGSVLSIFAINHLGMSVAVGIWAGLTIVVSFIWSRVIPDPSAPQIYHPERTYSGLVTLVLGVLLLSVSSTSFVSQIGKKKERHSHYEETDRLINTEKKIDPDQPKQNKLVGLACAITLGFLNGTFMLPMKKAPPIASNISFVVLFGIGVLVVTPVVAIIYFGIKRQIPQMKTNSAMIPGLCTGLIWSIGNVCAVYATQFLGLGIGYPLTQLALVVSGLWGIIAFKEITEKSSLIWWAVALLIIGVGVALLIFGAVQ